MFGPRGENCRVRRVRSGPACRGDACGAGGGRSEGGIGQVWDEYGGEPGAQALSGTG